MLYQLSHFRLDPAVPGPWAWCREPDSNWRHRDFQSRALPTELSRPWPGPMPLGGPQDTTGLSGASRRGAVSGPSVPDRRDQEPHRAGAPSVSRKRVLAPHRRRGRWSAGGFRSHRTGSRAERPSRAGPAETSAAPAVERCRFPIPSDRIARRAARAGRPPRGTACTTLLDPPRRRDPSDGAGNG